MVQFLGESFLISFVSCLFSVALLCLFLPAFNHLAGKHIALSTLLNPYITGCICLLCLLVGFIAGSYPAFFLSSFNPIEVLQGKVAKGFRNSFLRNSLVVFQFAVSVVLMLGTLVIYRQLNFIQNKNLGFNREQVLVISGTGALKGNAKAFRNELAKMPGVKSITETGYLPVSGARSTSGFVNSPVFDKKNFTMMQHWKVDDSYISTLQLQMQSGRNFSQKFGLDSFSIIINESAARSLGKDPLGKKMYRIEKLSTGELVAYTVVGIVKNFNFNSLHEEVGPLVLTLQADNNGMAVRVSAGGITGLIARVQSTWKKLVPSEPFAWSFMDESFNKQYDAELRTGKISMTFSILAILIACLGLFGLVTFAAEQRVREIGIRKVLGAGFVNIISMLSMDFVRLILLSVCIASPLAWWAMNKWLQGYAYRTDLAWWMFLVVGLAALSIAIVTVSIQSVKSAMANPIRSLRNN